MLSRQRNSRGALPPKVTWLLASLGLVGVLGLAWWSESEPPEGNVPAIVSDTALPGVEPITPISASADQESAWSSLGRKIFHDKALSPDSTMSCATCHDPGSGGSDGKPGAQAWGQKPQAVNTPTVFNSLLNFRLTWNGRARNLAALFAEPNNHWEMMGTRWEEVQTKVNSLKRYESLNRSLQLRELGRTDIERALNRYLSLLVTPDSRFDRYLKGDLTALSTGELRGYQLFKNNGCAGCHQGMNAGGNFFEKMSQVRDDPPQSSADTGRYAQTGKAEDQQHFRVPSLRNVSKTAPYFHDGSVATLEQAIELMAYSQQGVKLSAHDVHSMVLFLETLTGEIPKEAFP